MVSSAALVRGRAWDVAQSGDVDELRRRLEAAAAELEFGYVTATVVLDHAAGCTEFLAVHNAPADYAAFHDDPDGARRDPVAQHCKAHETAIVWTQGTYTKAGLGHFWEYQAAFGYRSGIAAARHLPFGRHFLLGLDGALPRGLRPRGMARLLTEFRLLVDHAQEAAFRILAPETLPASAGQSLSPFETEALRWSMDGQSPGEIAGLMKLSEARVRHHLESAMVKLECRSKHHAVLKAIRLGLLA
jgi:DNA-binding CsgD family transcriptional regulator